jgi:hypothetical protein
MGLNMISNIGFQKGYSGPPEIWFGINIWHRKDNAAIAALIGIIRLCAGHRRVMQEV